MVLCKEHDVAGWPDLHGFEGKERKNTENTKNTMNTKGKTGEIRGQTKG